MITIRDFYPVSEPNFCGNEENYILDCIKTKWVSSKGKYIERFEQEFAKYIGVKHAIAVSNGTTALHLALLAINISNSDQVIIPDLTYIATANVVKYVNAIPIFVDCEKDTWNIDPSLIEKKISKYTKAIICVHLYGHPVDLDPLVRICKENGLYLIEDAAEAIGSEYKGRKVGSIGDIAAFSFYGNKTITTGEGGMVVTNSDKLAEKIRILRNQGESLHKKYWYDIIGYNYRMTNLQAALGLAQLEKVNFFVNKKRQIASWYKKYLKHDILSHPVEKEYALNSYWMYSVLVNRIDRDRLISKLLKKRVEVRPFFYPLHVLPPYKTISLKEDFPNTILISSMGINLPSFTALEEDDVIFISSKVIEAIDELQ